MSPKKSFDVLYMGAPRESYSLGTPVQLIHHRIYKISLCVCVPLAPQIPTILNNEQGGNGLKVWMMILIS